MLHYLLPSLNHLTGVLIRVSYFSTYDTVPPLIFFLSLFLSLFLFLLVAVSIHLLFTFFPPFCCRYSCTFFSLLTQPPSFDLYTLIHLMISGQEPEATVLHHSKNSVIWPPYNITGAYERRNTQHLRFSARSGRERIGKP